VTRLGIYGGTFSPPHLGHVLAAEAFLREVELDRLLIIPTAVPPHKEAEDVPSEEHRLELCSLAFGNIPGAEISDLELRRGGKSYTYLTLRELELPEQKIFFLCGTDMLLSLDTWRNAEEVMRRASFTVISRELDPLTLLRMQEKKEALAVRYGAEIRILSVPAHPASSTEIRKAIAHGESIAGLVPEAVDAYIQKWNLYKT
jgi:nicotinate-nucleotide adenylyltransferase